MTVATLSSRIIDAVSTTRVQHFDAVTTSSQDLEVRAVFLQVGLRLKARICKSRRSLSSCQLQPAT